jgi:DNA invertase Pin-like site-specific DNA recombinase
MQLAELRRYCEARGWFILGEYIDLGHSGAKQERPELKRLLSDARARRFDTVLVWKLDRWGRSIQHSLETIQELTNLGIRFIAVTQNIDTDQSNPGSKFLLHIMAAFAELERELIRERINAGIAQAKAQGKKFGPPLRVFDREAARQLRREGKSWRAIAQEMKIPMSTIVDACREKTA